MSGPDLIEGHLADLTEAVDRCRAQLAHLPAWSAALALLLRRGGRLIAAGNGGSAAAAQHLVGELVGKLDQDRPALPGIALCADSCVATAIGNDYGYEQVFSRQVRAHARPGDVVVLMSTSGRSANLLAAAAAAGELGVPVWGLTGTLPNPLAQRCERVVAVPSRNAQVVQELHLLAVHLLCGYLDRALGVAPGRPAAAGAPVAVPAGMEIGVGIEAGIGADGPGRPPLATGDPRRM